MDRKQSIRRNIETLLAYNNQLTEQVEHRTRDIDRLRHQELALRAASSLHLKIPRHSRLCQQLSHKLTRHQHLITLREEVVRLGTSLAVKTQQLQEKIADNEQAVSEVTLVSQLKEQTAIQEAVVRDLASEAETVKNRIFDLWQTAKSLRLKNESAETPQRLSSKSTEAYYKEAVREMQEQIRSLKRDITQLRADEVRDRPVSKLALQLSEYLPCLPEDKREGLGRLIKAVANCDRQKSSLLRKIKEIEEETGDEVQSLQSAERLEQLSREVTRLRARQSTLLEEHDFLCGELDGLGDS